MEHRIRDPSTTNLLFTLNGVPSAEQMKRHNEQVEKRIETNIQNRNTPHRPVSYRWLITSMATVGCYKILALDYRALILKMNDGK